jgi:hypothetical protein
MHTDVIYPPYAIIHVRADDRIRFKSMDSHVLFFIIVLELTLTQRTNRPAIISVIITEIYGSS